MRNRLIIAVAAVVALAASAVVAYRVFAPGELVSGPTGSYPPAPAATPGVVGTLPSAPLLVDGRLRVFAAPRQVRADGPIDSRVQNSPYWSFRRWPAQLIGVVAPAGLVVTRWSDGELVALDARDGTVRWRVAGPVPDTRGYDGRRTGARTVYEPIGMHAAGGMVVLTSAADVRAYRADGTEAWRVPLERPGCLWEGFITGSGRFGAYDTCASAVRLLDLETGAAAGSLDAAAAGTDPVVEPLACGAARSGCGGVRVRGERGGRAWLFDRAGGAVPEAPALAAEGTWLVGEAAVRVDGDAVVGASARTGAELWRRPPPGPGAAILAAQPGRVHLLTGARDLVTLDAGTGAERSRTRYTYFAEKTDWVPGYAYAADGIVATERLRAPADPAEDDALYYFDAQPVILAAT